MFNKNAIIDRGKKFKRVNRKRFINWFKTSEYKSFILCGSKCSPYSEMFSSIINSQILREHFDFTTIENFLNHFEVMNCNYELGYYLKYYIEI